MNQNIFIVKSNEDLNRCFLVIKELRPHLNLEEYLSIYKEAHSRDDYEIAAIEQDGKIVALMGYRTLTDFVRGPHIYIDDLVTTESHRSQGLGKKLLQFAEKLASEKGFKTLRLAVVPENTGGIKFYEKNHWSKRAFIYTKKLP